VSVKGAWGDSLIFKTRCYPSCDSIPTGLDTIFVNDSTALITWNPVPDAQFYRISYKLATDTIWKTIETSKLNLLLDKFSACSTYQAVIQARCLGNIFSLRSNAIEFKTSCLISTDEPEYLYDVFTVSPNPFNSEIAVTIKLKEAGALTLRIFNAQGHEIFQSRTFYPKGIHTQFVGKQAFDFDRLPAGVYFIKVETNRGISAKRIVKQ
jgi:hypothetical protein